MIPIASTSTPFIRDYASNEENALQAVEEVKLEMQSQFCLGT